MTRTFLATNQCAQQEAGRDNDPDLNGLRYDRHRDDEERGAQDQNNDLEGNHE